jgi:hypothetical protein
MTPERSDRIARVSEFAAQKFSAAEIAMRMGCSRNAIIGLCDRHGIILLGGSGRRPAMFRAPRLRQTRAKGDKTQHKANPAKERFSRPGVYKPSRILMWAGLT